MRQRRVRSTWRFAVLLALVAVASPAALAARERLARSSAGDDAAVVTEWNALAFEVGWAEDELRTFKTQRAMAMAHLAMHDAVNAVLGRFAPFAFEASDPAADATVAAAQAAHLVLLSQYPAARARLDAALARWLDGRPAGEAARRGAALGARAAAVVLAAREGDGWDEPGSYTFRDVPGAYRTSSVWGAFVLQPGFRRARPFALRAPDQLRPPPPPALDSPAYRAAVEEVRRQGARDSVERTPEGTAVAIWWMEFAEGSINRLARGLVAERGLGLAEAARLFALLDVSLYDAYVATWDAKYEYDHWRPAAAIAAAAGAGERGAGAPSWEPLRPAPPFPEYVSAHAAGCAAGFEVLRRVVGDLPIAMTTTTAPPEMPRRSFPGPGAAAAECADSRVRLGWHFRYATDAGLELGSKVAAWVLENHLRPR